MKKIFVSTLEEKFEQPVTTPKEVVSEPVRPLTTAYNKYIDKYTEAETKKLSSEILQLSVRPKGDKP